MKLCRSDESINRRMVEEDWAWWFRKYAPRDEELMLAEQAARNTKRGLWADPNPLAPWEWKNGK